MLKQKHKILIVDDEQDILEFLHYNFENEGYDIITANNGQEAIDMAKKHNPDLIILDVMMPVIDGIETCRLLRKIPQIQSTLVVFLTARNEDFSEIAGFDAGADDYVAKPIRVRTLIARVKALLKRQKGAEDSMQTLVLDDIEIDIEKRVVVVNMKEINLPKKEFDLFLFLASKPEKVFTREEIFQNVWGNEVVVGDRTIDVHIRKLREKIGESYIKTSKGVGYCFHQKTTHEKH